MEKTMNKNLEIIRTEIIRILHENGKIRGTDLAKRVIEKVGNEKIVYREISVLVEAGEIEKKVHNRSHIEYELINLSESVNKQLKNLHKEIDMIFEEIVNFDNTSKEGKLSTHERLSSVIHSIHIVQSTTDHPELIGCAENFDIELWLQQGDDLGARMSKAIEDGLEEFDYALVLGCDCPWLKTEDLNLAYHKLASNKDVVLGPAEDGGYYLLGFRSSNKILFENMSWGGPDILQETRRRLQIAAIDWFELAEYPDLDVPEDLPAYERLLAI